MHENEKTQLKNLVVKYNDLLLNTMASAVSEDLLNLIIVNNEDQEFELTKFINNRQEYKEFVVREFLRVNSSSVIPDLKLMDEAEVFKGRKSKTQPKLNL
jgi:hypothetical protein